MLLSEDHRAVQDAVRAYVQDHIAPRSAAWDRDGHFPNDEAATKLLWLALRNITATWVRGARTWKEAMNQFAILYADRFTTPTTPTA